MRGCHRFAALAATSSLLLMCSSFGTLPADATTLDGGTDGAIDPIHDDAGPADGGADAAPAPCVRLEGLVCVDATEVTNAQYRRFYESGVVPGAAPGCGGGAPSPGSSLSNGSPDAPVVNVSWCDAASYCAWAGKHLCGALGDGGAIPRTSLGDPTQSEWQRACSDTTSTYESCNRDSGAPRPVGTAACGSLGISDLIGNVWEWVDSCDDAICYFMGGAFTQATAVCGTASGFARTAVANDVGLRCCAAP